LWSSGKIPSWRGHARGWLWWPTADGGPPSTWQEAAGRRGAAGLVVDGEDAILHTCGLGLQELYTRRLGDALYFATRVDPLLAIDDSRLHTDWQAWASTLALGAPMGEATPFREVRRMTAATAWNANRERLRIVRFEPHWLAIEPDARASVDDVYDILKEHVPRPGWRRPIIVTLSGGWDSRLLAAIARPIGLARAPTAWTTSPDDGYDEDVEFSRPVATALRLHHRIVIPDADAYRTEHTAVFDRVQHQTHLHTWLMPLARELHNEPGALLDGLGGEILLRTTTFVDEVASEAPAGGRRDLLWTRLAAGRLDQREWYAPGVAAQFEEASRESFGQAISGVYEHPEGATLSVLLTRTARVIATSPLCVFAPESDIRLPFLHPSLIAAALSVPIRKKAKGQFYRDLLRAVAGREVAELPSTNDHLPHPAAGPRRQTQPSALAELVAPIAADDTVRALLGLQLLPALDDAGERVRICTFNGPRTVLQWACMLADWRRKYAGVLAAE
jgi:hypothetical protein